MHFCIGSDFGVTGADVSVGNCKYLLNQQTLINTKSMKFQLCADWLKKDLIDLAGISGYNGIEVIYLWGMAFAFPTNIQKEVYGCGHRNKKCCECGGQRRTIR